MTSKFQFNEYRLLGKSGLRVSPLCLGAMTFGDSSGWSAGKDEARKLFLRYKEAGGNFIDTADLYMGGQSEEWIGEFIQETKARDWFVITTKFSFNAEPGNPNAGGQGRKNITRALEGSLRRLKTDRIDVYCLHAWDLVTPVEEVIETLNNLVRQGKILHLAMSNVPAWYASRAQTIAQLRGWEPLAMMQLEYSLVSRSLEREHLPLAIETGISICPWSPLASGFLTGKYKRTEQGISGEGRIQVVKDSGNPTMEKFAKTPRNWVILDALQQASREMGKRPVELALNWVANRRGVASTLIGATRIEQLEANLASLNFVIPEELSRRLDEASRPEPTELDHFFGPVMQSMIHGGTRLAT